MQLTPAAAAQQVVALSNDDAVAVVSEFFSSMDNLPGEVAFLLQEIKAKDDKIQDLTRRNQARTSAVYRSIRPLAQPPSTPPISARDASNLQKIEQDWARIEELSKDKVLLAERLGSIVGRARERGRDEWRKVSGGMEEDDEDGLVVGAGGMVGGGVAGGIGLVKSLQGVGGVQQFAVAGSGMDDKAIKKRKTNPSYYTDMPPPPAPYSVLPSQSTIIYQDHTRLSSSSYQPQARKSRGREDLDMDYGAGAGAQEQEEEGGEGEDEKVYCFCQEKSYGEMIGCDNDNCKREWFHLKCVKLEPPLPEQWYCSECQAQLDLAAQQARTKKQGRKK